MQDDSERGDDLPRPSRLPVLLAGAITLVWALAVLLFIVIAINPAAIGSTGLDTDVLGRLVSFALLTAAPLAVLWLVAALLRERSAARAAETALLQRTIQRADHDLTRGHDAVGALETRIETLFQRLEELAAPINDHAATLAAATARLDAGGTALSVAATATLAAGSTLAAATPAAMADGERLTALLAETETRLQQQLAETETLLAGLWGRVAELQSGATAASAAAATELAALTARASEAEAALSSPIRAIADAADAAFMRTAAAADATRDGVHTQTSALLASVEQARVTFDHIGRESALQIGQRLDTIMASAAALTVQIDDQAGRYQAMMIEVERGFAVLDAKLGNSVATGNTALESIALRMADARDAIYRLGEPIAETDSALAAVEGRVADMDAATMAALQTLGRALPATLPQVSALSDQLQTLEARTAALAQPIASGGDSISTAQAQLEAARAALEGAATVLSGELERARASLAEIDTLTGSAALTASTQLIDAFARVRDVASQTAGTMRETLGNVVSEAEDALDKAGTARAELAFAAPIRAQLADIEAANAAAAAAAQGATERVTQRLLALTRTIATVEARIDEADAHYDMRLRDDIAKRSSSLLDSLKDGAIDIAKLLAIDVDDNAWARYLRGDKGLFARRAVRLIDSGTERAIARHFQHDPAFAEQASRYITEFEALIARVLPDREGKGLAVTLLSSDVGKLYVALAQATERLR